MSGPSPEARARLLAAVRATPSPTRASHRRLAWALAGGTLLVAFGGLVAMGGVRPGGRGPEAVYGTAVGWLVLALAGAWAAVGRGRSMLGRPRDGLLVVACGMAPALVVWTAVAGGLGVAGEDPGVGAHLTCFALATAFALTPLAFVAWLRRGTDPVHPRVTGASLGAVAGGVGAVLIDLHCPATYAAHVVIGHVLPVVLLALAGALLGPRLVGVAPAPPR